MARLTDGNCAIVLSCQEEPARERAKQLIAPDEVRIASLRRKNAAIIMEGGPLKRARLSPNKSPMELLIAVAVYSRLKLEADGARPSPSFALANTKQVRCS